METPMPRPPNPPPAVGTRFGRWTVISEEVRRRPHGNKTYPFAHVQCDCGKFNWVCISRLRGGHSRSCGCAVKEKHTRFLKWRAPLPKTFEA